MSESKSSRNAEVSEETPLLPRVAPSEETASIISTGDSSISVDSAGVQVRPESAAILLPGSDEARPKPVGESSKTLSSLKADEEEGYWTGFIRILTKGPNKKTNKNWVW